MARVKRINVELILKARALQVSFRPRFALYRIVFVPAQKQNQFRMGHLFTHTNGDFGAISAIERRCAAPILKVESRISDRFSHHIRKPVGTVVRTESLRSWITKTFLLLPYEPVKAVLVLIESFQKLP